MIGTRLTELLAVRVPLLSAPMTPQAGGELARAVSQAGGLGMLGFDEDESVESIETQLAIVRGDPPLPFGIGLVVWVLEQRLELLDLAIDARPALVSISFGDPAPYVERLHAAGIVVASQVQSEHTARVAIDAGVDVVVAQGGEAGGHTGSVATLPLLQLVLDLTDRPVVAAGGIATGRGLAAVLAAGAEAAWIGTPFLLAEEARNSAGARERIAHSHETDTIYTSIYDRLQGKPWPAEVGARALTNPFVEQWSEQAEEITSSQDAVAAFARAKREGDYSVANIYAGQSVGLIDRVRPATEIVAAIASQAEVLLRRW